jgi:hypothetical protein
LKKKTSDFSSYSEIDLCKIESAPQRARNPSDAQNVIDKFKISCEPKIEEKDEQNNPLEHKNKSVRRNRKERLKSAHSNQRIQNQDQNIQNVQPNK